MGEGLIETLHAARIKNGTVKLKKDGEKYLVIHKKSILGFALRKKIFEFKNYEEAEDLYRNIKTDMNYSYYYKKV